jgi:hypothetical protein
VQRHQIQLSKRRLLGQPHQLPNRLVEVATTRLLLELRAQATTPSCVATAQHQRAQVVHQACRAHRARVCHAHSGQVRHCALVNVRHAQAAQVAQVVHAAQVGQVHVAQVARRRLAHQVVHAAQVVLAVAGQVLVVDQLVAVLAVRLVARVSSRDVHESQSEQDEKSSTTWRPQVLVG